MTDPVYFERQWRMLFFVNVFAMCVLAAMAASSVYLRYWPSLAVNSVCFLINCWGAQNSFRKWRVARRLRISYHHLKDSKTEAEVDREMDQCRAALAEMKNL